MLFDTKIVLLKSRVSRKTWYVLLLAVSLAVLGGLGYRWSNQSPDVQATAQRVELHLAGVQEEVQSIFSLSIWDSIPQKAIPDHLLHAWHEAPFGLFAYWNDSLSFWNRYDYLQPLSSRVLPDSVVKLKNGVYWRLSYPANSSVTIVVLYPLQLDYEIQNQYLINEPSFDHLLSHKETWQVEPPASGRFAPVGEKLGYVVAVEGDVWVPYLTRLLWTLGLIVGLWALSRLFSGWGRLKQQPWFAFGALLILTGGCRAISLWWYPDILTHIELFSPRHYGASDLSPSLGDLLLNVALVLYWCMYWVAHVPMVPMKKKWHRWLAALLAVWIVLGSGLYILEITETLVIDSSIVFDISDFFAISHYTLVGLLIMAVLMLIWFLLIARLVPFAWQNMAGWRQRWRLLVAAVVIYLPLVLWYLPIDDVILSLFTGLLLLGVFSLLEWRGQQLRYFWTQVFWITVFALITAAFLHRFNTIKQGELRELYARSLTQQDHLTEFLFSQVRPQLMQDAFLRGYFANPLISKRQLKRRLNFLYFKDQLNKYDIEVYTYLDNAIPYKNEYTKALSDFFIKIDSSGRTTSVPDLYFFPETPNNLEYLAMLRVYKDPDNPISENQVGRIVLSFNIQSYGLSSVYPELLLSESVRESVIGEEYDYAFYVRNKLVKREGSYPYPLQYEGGGGDRFHAYEAGEFLHLIYEEIPGRSVWLTQRKASYFKPLSLFSYLFCLFLLLLILSNGVFTSYRYITGRNVRVGWQYLSFRSRIQLFIVLIIVSSFVLIGVLTVTNIKSQYNEYHYERLLRKTKQILSGLEYLRDNSTDSVTTWENFFRSDELYFHVINLSEIHSMDINLYDKRGRLMESSQPDIFNKGLIARLEDPVAGIEMETGLQSQYIQSESIGGLRFISAYVPLLNPDQKIAATLNLPYYAKEKNLNAEINSFLVYFINIYVLLFVLAGMLGVLVSNSITRPLTVLGDKMKLVKLGKQNEPIRWRTRDEIGQLIAEYNKMIDALEESARLLAKSERESAWREMARQVAHEIKNPLTPMKLSIQLLQRAQKEGRTDLDARVARTSDTLIEQIENLNRIASEFSAFAKMPPADMEPLVINDLVRNVIDLFRNEEVAISAHIPATTYRVYADKSQIIRVLNNLIKNAIQAIPDDRAGEIFVGIKQENDEVIIKVEDNGIGISAEQAEKVFVPNFTTKSSGMGLGLAMARKIVELSKGTITFTSDVGKGTTFFVTLPLFDEAKGHT